MTDAFSPLVNALYADTRDRQTPCGIGGGVGQGAAAAVATGEVRAQWALEETGLPYRVHALDHTAGELDSDAYGRISPFHQAPVIDDDGFVVAESIRKTDLMEPFPGLKAYYERCQARPAWQRTLGLHAERLGVSVDDIR
ncbi:glutathione S-transferase N-terminal domain-containing protein [Sorangium sp. So ce362]|uniref:glutathione S-transferase N-terminal domain-containing protein n=1 Tax=Sorangium sp. So ce362 TaxID=3133303 RepID=UPI003F60C233